MLLADSLTWWHGIPSSQRTSWSRPSSPSVAPYVVFLYLDALFCGQDRCTISITIMVMTDSEMHSVPATQCLFFPLTPLPKQDVQTKLRDTYKKTGDEFMTNRIATLAKVCHICAMEKSCHAFIQTVKNEQLTIVYNISKSFIGSVL